MITCHFEDRYKAFLRHVVVDGIIVQQNQILLVKRAASSLYEAGKYALPGGFLERDETTREGVLREVLEETGYQCEIVSLFRINDNPDREGDDRQNVSFVFLLRTSKKIGEHDLEIEKIKWFNLENLPPKSEFAFDHYDNIVLYLKYHKQKFNLPIVG